MTDIDPLIKAIFDRLPPAGSAWSEEDRQTWLRAVVSSLNLVYLTDAPEENRNGLLWRPISELDVSLRAVFALSNQGIVRIEHILTKTERELLRIPNFGPRSLNEVKAALAKLGLCLRPTPHAQVMAGAVP